MLSGNASLNSIKERWRKDQEAGESHEIGKKKRKVEAITREWREVGGRRE